MRKVLSLLLIGFLLSPIVALAAVRGKKAMYMGGTISKIPDKTKGKFDVTGEKGAVFLSRKGESLLEIPYESVTSLEYGQKSGRRVGVAIAVTWVALFSKKRRHFLTIGFKDAEGNRQGAVFELAKGTVRTTLVTLEARTGVEVEFESEEARKHAN